MSPQSESDACMKPVTEHHVNEFLVVDSLPKTREMLYDRTGVSVVGKPKCDFTKTMTNSVCSMNAVKSGFALMMDAENERLKNKCGGQKKK